MALPTLTWNLVGPMAIISGTAQMGDVSGPGTKQYLMYTLKSLVQSSSYWLIADQDATGSATEALILKPNPTHSATPNMRIVATGNVSGALGGVSGSSTMQDRAAGIASSNAQPGLLVGFSPDVSPNPTWVTGSWNSDKPWGPTVRWSKYWYALPTGVAGAAVDQMYLLESSEALFIGCKGRSGFSRHFGLMAGAFIRSADSGSGEMNVDGVGRVFGMTCIGPGSALTGVDTAWLGTSVSNTNNLGPWGCNTNVNVSTYTGVFIVSGGIPNGPQVTGGTNTNNWELCGRTTLLVPTDPSDTLQDRSKNISSGESVVGFPVPISSFAGTIRFVGFLRQIYSIHDMPALLAIATGSNNNPTIIGYSWSSSEYSSGDAVIFSNSNS